MSGMNYLDQLLKRIESLEGELKGAQHGKLLKRIESLESELNEAHELISRISKRCHDFDMNLVEHLRLHDRQLADIEDRLVHTELHLFPDLPRDLKDITDIIGENDGKSTKLDRRDI